jgi:hypothetical protein
MIRVSTMKTERGYKVKLKKNTTVAMKKIELSRTALVILTISSVLTKRHHPLNRSK